MTIIPTNQPNQRVDSNDTVYKTEREKFRAAVAHIMDCHERGQPVLVGTISVEKSELVAKMLKTKGIPHHVLNAKHHAKEAEYVSQAGRKGAITISTNMAGRGTDIVLGGNAEALAKAKTGAESGEAFDKALEFFKERCQAEREDVLKAGGLLILGTERHESRRIDNQLRGRAARQGDPGGASFFLSLEDDLLRIFGGDKIQSIMDWLKVPEDEPIEHKMVSRAIEKAQIRVEEQNFGIRKNLLEFDNVLNQQRMTIYDLRQRVMEGTRIYEMVDDAIEEVVYDITSESCPEHVAPEEWDLDALKENLRAVFTTVPDFTGVEREFEALEESAANQIQAFYKERRQHIMNALAETRELEGETREGALENAATKWRFYEQERYMRELDKQWRAHLLDMDHLKDGVYLSAYAQKDPKVLYKKEGYTIFADMLSRIRHNLVEHLMRVEVRNEQEIERLKSLRRKQRMEYVHGQTAGQQAGAAPSKPKTVRRNQPKLGRNDPCHCGSGKKYKSCCLRKDEAAEG